jgi:hypothetical protein
LSFNFGFRATFRLLWADQSNRFDRLSIHKLFVRAAAKYALCLSNKS